MNRALITGLGIVSPSGREENEFEKNIREAYCPVEELDIGPLPGGQKAMAARYRPDSRKEGRAVRMILDAAGQALRGAPATDLEDMAIFVGTSLGDIESVMEAHKGFLSGDDAQLRRLLANQPENLARQIAADYNISGPRLTLSCACTSGTSALGQAFDWLRLGRSRRCLVCAVDTLNEFVLSGFSSLWALTQELPRPFDRSRTGMALGEAAAAVLLETEAAARERGAKPRVELAGYGASGDAVHITAPDRAGKGATRAIRSALDDAGWSPGEVDYLNVHATGSIFNDAMIIRSIMEVFGQDSSSLPVSSVNPCTGHTLGAAGLAEAVAVVLAMEKGFVPPTPNLENPESDDLLLVRNRALEAELKKAVSLTTGFGGANTALAFSVPREGVVV